MLQLIPQLVKCLSRDGAHGLPGFIRDHNVLPYQAVNTLGVQAKPAFILYAVYKEAKCLVVMEDLLLVYVFGIYGVFQGRAGQGENGV